MDFTNEKKYLDKLFEQKEKLAQTSKILKESYNIDSEFQNDVTLVLKTKNMSAFEKSQLKNKLTENLDEDTVRDIVFE